MGNAIQCVVPENIHTPPRRIFSSLTPHPTGFSIPEGFALLPPPPSNSIEAVQQREARYIKKDYNRTSSVTEMLKSLDIDR